MSKSLGYLRYTVRIQNTHNDIKFGVDVYNLSLITDDGKRWYSVLDKQIQSLINSGCWLCL